MRCQHEAKNVRRATDECGEALLQVVGMLRDRYLPEAARTG
jgi:hypothetical protein